MKDVRYWSHISSLKLTEITLKTFPDPSRNSEEKEKAEIEKKAKRMAIAKLSASKTFCVTSKRNETK